MKRLTKYEIERITKLRLEEFSDREVFENSVSRLWLETAEGESEEKTAEDLSKIDGLVYCGMTHDPACGDFDFVFKKA